ncbi:MAG: TRAP transporter small permease subunit [Beijerinckiaceae bacterium]
MQGLLGISRVIDAINTRIGRFVAWAILVAIMIATVNAIVRKLFDTSSNAWLEAQWVLFGVVFLLCAPWTLIANEHIRIDIVNSRFSKRTRDWIDVFGHIFFLLPLCIIMVWHSWPFFLRSFRLNEQSLNAGGLPQWPAKSLVFIGFVLLLAQGISELIKRIAIIRGEMIDPHEGGGGHHAAAEAEAARLREVAEAEARRFQDTAAANAAGTSR